ncbi:Predicted AAA-ATPase [Anaerobiospirillum thomasii]|uniref:AAA family ATPase n=1 Tax=Anaerobiospirillum thomasii TaxID=179995 RepID=UPI000D82CAD1|nr:AAA family ATPase [Anaerobiospirillum thomasii]SPT71816.1 Predicted AAA-ATPase [Anaerobiospirillum thomasii]
MHVCKKRLPADICSFEHMIYDNYIYVDKTDLIGSLVQHKGPFLFIRPKGFGKTTLLSTMQCLFVKGHEHFSALNISHNFQVHKSYAVLLIDFAAFKGSGSDIKGQRAFYIELIKDFFKEQGVDLCDSYMSLASVLDAGLSRIKKQVVLLIDNYDAPLSQALCNKDLFAGHAASLGNFYAVIKSYSDKFKFIFITGSLRFTDSTVFASFNNMHDISFKSEYAALTGFTQQDLDLYFKDYIQSILTNKYALGNDNAIHCTYSKLVESMRAHYGGYCFDLNCKNELYNPALLIDFLQRIQQGLLSYNTDIKAITPSYLSEFVTEHNDDSAADSMVADGIASVFNKHSFIKSIDSLKLDVKGCDNVAEQLVSLIFYSGLVSIKSAQLNALELVIPNLVSKRAYSALHSLPATGCYDT